jgi:DNA repair protein RadC
MTNGKNELFRCDLLDTKHKAIRGEIVSISSLTASIAPQETFKARNPGLSAAVIFNHNQPRGDTKPSEDDILLTRRLAQTANVLGIQVLNHIIIIIIADGCHFSFMDNGLIQRSSQTGARVTA